MQRLSWFPLALLLSLGGTGAGAVLPDLANWGGASLLSLVQDRVNGKVTAREISGNPLTGITYQDLEISGPDGKPVLTAERLEIRLSLWSIPTLHLDLGTLALVKPRLYLSRDRSGQWNVSQLIKRMKRPPNPPNPRPGGKITPYVFRGLDLSNLTVHQGELLITQDGRTDRYTDLDLKAGLSLLNLGQPQQTSRGQHRRTGNHHASGPGRTGDPADL